MDELNILKIETTKIKKIIEGKEKIIKFYDKLIAERDNKNKDFEKMKKSNNWRIQKKMPKLQVMKSKNLKKKYII